MKKFVLLTLFSISIVYSQNTDFDRYFVDKTMRVDYYHSGTKSSESFSLDEIFEYQKWSGNKNRLIDDRNLGEYLVRVYDIKSNNLIFSKGYCTIFNEWQTTDEALKGTYKTYSETLLLPFPKNEIQLTICRRNKKMRFDEIFSTLINPLHPIINRESRKPDFKVNKVVDNGPSDKKVDLVILGDGYSKEEIKKFNKDVERFTKTLFNTEPFKSRKNDFNIFSIEAISEESGIDNPRNNIWRNTALSTTYNSFYSQRYIILADNKSIRDIAGLVPYDYIYILVNSDEYGGGAIFNLWAVTYTKSTNPELDWQCDYVFIHEFGHSFTALGDEYYTSDVAYNDFYPEGIEPWETNLTRLLDKSNLKWGEFIQKDTPIPTPWGKSEYDSLDLAVRKLDRSKPEYYTKRNEITEKQQYLKKENRYSNKVGIFEGAGYASKGIYRPYSDCIMFSLSLIPFDPVCTATIKNTIDFYTK